MRRFTPIEDDDAPAYSTENDDEVTMAAAALRREQEEREDAEREDGRSAHKERCVPCEGGGVLTGGPFKGEQCWSCDGSGLQDASADEGPVDYDYVDDERFSEAVLIAEVTGDDLGDD